MDKSIIYTFACESKRTTHSHEITSIIKTFIQMYNKRISPCTTNDLPKRETLPRCLLR
jgi:hypothetical protein